MVEVVALASLVLVAFAGGALGAAIGGMPAFSLAGVVIVVGEAARIGGRAVAEVGGADPAALGPLGITASIGLGPALGPHVAFAGGVAAAAYAARRDRLDTGFDYHEAKHVTYALGTAPDVLVVGGAFGVVGLVLARASEALALPWDPVFAAIVVSGFLHRIAFGYPLIGNVRGDVLDMSPFERGERRRPVARGAGGDTRTDGGEATDRATGDARYLVEPWLPHQYEWANVALLGAVVGVFGAFVAHRTGSPFLAFGIAAASLVFLNLGMERMPVTHHMALPASVAVVGLAGGVDPSILAGGVTPAEFSGTVALWIALLVGAAFGLVAGVAGELAQRALYAHADTHLDPPAASIVATSLLVAALDLAGVFQQNVVPTL